MRGFQIFYAGMVLVALSASAHAQVSDCDRLAAAPSDPQKQAPGVAYNRLNASLAVPACKKATEESPQLARVWFQYGRALEKANRLPDAITAYQEAARLKSGVAFNNIGELYRDGKGFQKDLKKAEEYFTQAASLNSPEGKDNLAQLRKSAQAVVPKQFQGYWAESQSQCKEFGLEVDPARIYSPYIETVCMPREVQETSATSMTGKFSCKTAVAADVPYPKTTESFEVTLTADGRLFSKRLGLEKPLVRCR